jgi:hypothetical protein
LRDDAPVGCLVVLFALISPRLALIATWLFSDVLDRAFDGWILPVAGFLLLPWTTLAWAWMYDTGRAVEGWEWIVVVLAVLADLGALGGSGRGRR